MPEAVIVSTARTPIGRAAKGSLVDARPDDLVAFAIRTAVEQVPGLPHEEIVDVIVGCGFPQETQGMNLGRRAALLAGLPETVPGLTVNRFCASSLQTIRMAFHAIKAGEGDAFVAAGVESTSQVNGYPEVGGGAPSRALRRRRADRERLHPDGADGGERRRALGRLARGHGPLRAAVAGARGRGAGVRASSRARSRRTRASTADDGPRPSSTFEKLQSLEPAFKPGGKVTAGNSCPLNDGAAAVVVMSADRARELGIEPRARIIASACPGVEPEIMGVGPIEAMRKVLAQAGMTIDDVDVMELNEAFAAQVIAGLPRGRRRSVRRQAEPARRRDRARPPVRDDRRADHGHAAERPRDARPDDRARDDVRRRRPGHGDARRAALETWARSRSLLALGSSLVWGIGDFAGGSLTQAAAGVRGHGGLAGGRVRRALVAVAVRGDVGSRSFWLGLIAGAGGGAGLAAFYRALSLGTMSVVSPLVACGAVVPFAISLATGERPAAVPSPAPCVALGGAVLASVEERRSSSPERSRAIVLAVVAALALGLFVYFLGLGSREGDALSTLVRCTRRLARVLIALALVAARAAHACRARRSPQSRRSGSPTCRRTRSSRSRAATACSRSSRCSARSIRS